MVLGMTLRLVGFFSFQQFKLTTKFDHLQHIHSLSSIFFYSSSFIRITFTNVELLPLHSVFKWYIDCRNIIQQTNNQTTNTLIDYIVGRTIEVKWRLASWMLCVMFLCVIFNKVTAYSGLWWIQHLICDKYYTDCTLHIHSHNT